MSDQSIKTEQQLIINLSSKNMRLVSAWLYEEASLRAPEYSPEVYETFKYTAHRLEILTKKLTPSLKGYAVPGIALHQSKT